MAEHNFTRRKLPPDSVPDVLRHKWSAPVMDEGYTPLPKRLLRCLSLIFTDVRDLQAVLSIVDFDRPKLTRLPSVAYLAFIAGLSEDEFQSRVASMRDQGYLTIAGTRDGLQVDISPLLQRILDHTGGDTTAAQPF